MVLHDTIAYLTLTLLINVAGKIVEAGKFIKEEIYKEWMPSSYLVIKFITQHLVLLAWVEFARKWKDGKIYSLAKKYSDKSRHHTNAYLERERQII